MAGNDRIKIVVEGDSDDLEAALARSRESIKGVGDESDRQTTRAGRVFDRLRAKLRRPIQARVDADTTRAKSRLEDIAADVKRLAGSKATVKVGADTSEVDRKLRAVRAEIRGFGSQSAQASAGTDRLNTSVGGLNGKFQLLRNGMRLLKWPAFIAGAGLAVQAISSLAAGTFALGSALAPLSSNLIAYPGFLAAIAQGTSVWKLATGGVMQAVGGLNEKLDTSSKAFKQLSPEAQKFARYLQQLKPHLRDIQQTAQRGLLPGLREGLHDAMRNLPVVERLVGRTARALGGLAAQGGKALGSAEWGRDIERIGNSNVVILTRLGRAAGHAANAVRHIAVAAGPTLRALAGDVEGLAKRLADAAERGRESGRLGAYFERGRQVLHQVARIAGDAASAIGNIGTAAGPSGRKLLAALGASAERWRAWTASVRGQNALRKYFTDAEPNVRAMGRLIAEAGKAFLRIGATPGLEKTLQTVRTRLIPALERMLTTMAGVAGPDVVNALASIAELFAALSPYVAQVAKFVAWAAGGLADLVRKEPAVGTLVATVGGLGLAFKALSFTGILGGLKFLAGPARAAASAVGSVVGAILRLGRIKLPHIDLGKIVRGGLGKIGIAFTIADELRRAVPIALREATKIGAAFKRGTGPGIKQTAKSVWEIFKQAPPIRGLVTAAQNAFKIVKGIFGRKVVARLTAVGTAAVREAKQTARAVGRWIKQRFNAVLGALDRTRATVSKAVRGARNFAAKVFRATLRVIDRTIDTVRRAIGRGVSFGRKVFEATIRVLDRVTKPVRTAIGKVVGFGRKVGSAVLGAVAQYTKPLRTAIGKVTGFGRKKGTASLAAEKKKVDSIVAAALAKLRDFVRRKWEVKITAEASGVARARDQANRYLSQIRDENVTIWVSRRRRRAEGGPVLGGFAAGGAPDFSDAPTRKSMGGRHSRPTYLVGEENRPEFVIATNPAYRKANLEYLSMAAAALKAPMVPAFAGGGEPHAPGARQAEDGSWINNPGAYWGGGGKGGGPGGGSKFLSFNVTAGFASGGYPGDFGHRFRFSESTPRTRYGRDGHPRVRSPRGAWIPPLRYMLEAAREREAFYELLSKMRGGRSSGEWGALSKDRRERVTRWWEARRDTIDKRHEHWEQRFDELRELFGQRRGLQLERRKRRAFGRRVQRGQLGVLSQFAGQYVGSFSRGTRGPISLPRRFGSSGIAEVHRGETIRSDPQGAYGSQLAPATASAPPIKVEVVLKDRAGALVDVIDARIDGRSAPVVSREIGRRTRRIASAPGARRPTYAR